MKEKLKAIKEHIKAHKGTYIASAAALGLGLLYLNKSEELKESEAFREALGAGLEFTDKLLDGMTEQADILAGALEDLGEDVDEILEDAGYL